MSYRKIDPRMWDDERFATLSQPTKLVWLLILTGPHTTPLPGLSNVGVAALAESSRYDADTVSRGLAELSRAGMVEFNPTCRVLRVPNAPKYNPCSNPKVLKGWLSCFRSVPDCAEKFRHLASLHASLPADEPWAVSAWRATFGAIVVPPRYAGDTPPDTVQHTVPDTVSDTLGISVSGASSGASSNDPVGSGASPSPTRTESKAEKAGRRAAERAAAREAVAQREDDRKAAREAKAEAKRVDDERKASEKAERLRRAEEEAAKHPPMPFKVIEALRAIASSAGGRFSAPEDRDLTGGYVIAINASIRAYPAIDEWHALGRWMASPDCTYQGRLGVAWAASSALRDGMARARSWVAQGNLLAPPSRFTREAPPAAIPPPPVVKRGDLAVDQPAMSRAELAAFAEKHRAEKLAGGARG